MASKIKDITDLPGIGAQAAEKLYAANYKTLESIAIASPLELIEVAGLGEKTAEKAINAAREALGMGFETADMIQERRAKIGRISTGSKELDALLGGGIESLPADEDVLVIDSKGNLRREKIGPLVEKQLEINGYEKKEGMRIAYSNKENIEVPAFDENYRIKVKKISAFVKHKRTEKILEVWISGGRKIRVTEGHSLFKLDGLSIVPAKAGELRKGDFIAVPKRIPVESREIKINAVKQLISTNDPMLRKVFAKSKGYVAYLYENFREELGNALVVENLKERFLWDWKYEGILPLNVLRHLPEKAFSIEVLEKYNVQIGNKYLINAVVPLNIETAWLLGFLTAEMGASIGAPQIGISQEITNVGRLIKVQSIFKQYAGLTVQLYDDIRERSAQKKIVSGNIALWLLLKSLGLCKYCYEKRIPDFIFGAKKDIIAAFLQGYFEGDGVIKRGTIGFCTSSENLAKDIALLLLILGEIPVIMKHKSNGRYKDMHFVYAFKLKNINDLGKNTEERHTQKVLPIRKELLSIIRKHKLSGKLRYFYTEFFQYQPTYSTVRRFFEKIKKLGIKDTKLAKIERLLNSDLLFEKVVKIDYAKEQPDFVYDLQVLDNPIIDNFVAGNYVCAHNTQSITEVYGKMASGKCVSKDTNIFYLNPNAPHIETIEEFYNKYAINERRFDSGYIAELKRPVKVIGINKRGNIERAEVRYLYKEKVKTLQLIETERGAKIKLTGFHPLLTLTEEGIQWKSAELLKPGDFIGMPKEIQTADLSKLSEEDAYFIGLFVAEGCRNPLSITNYNKRIQNKVARYVERRFGYKPKIVKEKGLIILQKPTRELLKELADCTASDKFIPEEVMQGPKEVIEAFLRGYLEGDCYISKVISICTKSKKLSEQLAYLLAMLGIHITVREKNVQGKKYYRLYITDTDSKRRIERIMQNSTKNKKISGEKNISTKYCVPIKVIEPLYRRVYSKLSGSRRRFNKWSKKAMCEKGYKNLFVTFIGKSPHMERVTEKTLNDMVRFFKTRLNEIKNAQKLLKTPSPKNVLRVLSVVPIQTKVLCKKLGLKKSTLQNYITRHMSEKAARKIAVVLKVEISDLLKDEELRRDLRTLEILASGRIQWEKIVRKNEVEYNDWVYDVVVPKTHSFIGGNKPIFLHNTQWCFQLSVMVQLPPEQGGLDGKVVYIDSEASFRPERIVQIAEARGLDPQKALKNIFVARAYNADHQMLLADKASDIIKKNGVRLLIVDSLTAQFRAEYIGRGLLAERQQKLNKHMHQLMRLAEMYNLAVLVTNQVMERPDILFGDPTAPIGGNVVGHASKTRLYLRQSKGNKRVARLVDSPSLPDGEAIYRITERGIEDDA